MMGMAIAGAFVAFNVVHMRWKLRYYTRVKWQYFLIDFCYWNNAMVTVLLAATFFHAPCAVGHRFAAIAFAHATGSVFCAIVLWGNKLFLDPQHEEDWELLSSTVFHALPAVCLYALNWPVSYTHLTLPTILLV